METTNAVGKQINIMIFSVSRFVFVCGLWILTKSPCINNTRISTKTTRVYGKWEVEIIYENRLNLDFKQRLHEQTHTHTRTRPSPACVRMRTNANYVIHNWNEGDGGSAREKENITSSSYVQIDFPCVLSIQTITGRTHTLTHAHTHEYGAASNRNWESVGTNVNERATTQ